MSYIFETTLVILTLVLLEGLLSADNALVLAILVKHLSNQQRKRALLYGIAGAFAFRLVALLAAGYLIRLWYLRALGAAYLLYLCVHYFLRRGTAHSVAVARVGPSFWRTVLMVELTDIAFALDSVLVAVGLSQKLWVIYLGAVLGILAIRIAAGLLIRLLERFPSLEDSAYLLVGWIGCKLGVESWEAFSVAVRGHPPGPPLLPHWLFWTIAALVVVAGFFLFGRKQLPRKKEADLPGEEQGAED